MTIQLPFMVGNKEEETFNFLCGYVKDELWGTYSFAQSTLVSWCTLGACILLVILLWRRKNRQWLMQHLVGCAVGVFLLGTFLYIIGFNHEGTGHNPLALLLRSMMASIEMFVSDSELIEVQEEIKCNPYYMMVFSITHFLAICISAAFILHILGVRFVSAIKMFWLFNWRKNLHLYIFFDLSDESVTLAKSIAERKKGERHQIIFVRTPMEEHHLERFSFSHLLSFADSKNDKLEDILALNAYLTYSRRSIVIDMPQKEWKSTMGLNRLKRYIGRRGKELFFFCMSMNEDANINTAVALHEKYPDAHVYCHARKSHARRLLEDSRFKLVDTSNLSVMELKNKGEYHPVSMLPASDVDCNTATVKGEFNALILGLGETGRDIYRFLHEFSALPMKDHRQLPVNIYAIDKAMDKIAGAFLHQMPAIEKREKANPKHFIKSEMGAESFWNALHPLVNKLNCVYVTLGDNRQDIETAIDIYEYLFRNREANLAPVYIFVRCYQTEYYRQMNKIIEKYNNKACSDSPRLVLFGAMESLLNYDMIVDDTILKQAQLFHAIYENMDLPMDKQERIKRCRQKWDLDFGKQNSLLQEVFDTKRRASQNIANSLHIPTILRLGGKTAYKDLSKEQRENLSICEHQRWVAAHELLGYDRYVNGAANLRQKVHKDMVEYDEIGEHIKDSAEREEYKGEKQGYDFKVIETSYKLS